MFHALANSLHLQLRVRNMLLCMLCINTSCVDVFMRVQLHRCGSVCEYNMYVSVL